MPLKKASKKQPPLVSIGAMRKIYRHFVEDALKPRHAFLQEDIDFMSQHDAAAHLWPRFFSHIMLWSIFAFIVIAFIWAALASVDEITEASGKVVPSSQIQVIQNLEGGIVSKIQVQVGQHVSKGELLMQLDKTRFSSSSQENEAKVNSLKTRVARLTAEAYDKPVDFPQTLVRDQPELVEHERSLYQARQQELHANISVLKKQAEQSRQGIWEKKSREAQLEKSLSLVNQELAMTRPLLEQGVVSEVEVLRLERQVNDLKGDLDSTRIDIRRLTSANKEILDKIEGTKMKFISDAMNELSEEQNELASSSALDVAIGDRLARTDIRSPVNGIIKQIMVNTVGGVVQPGMELMQIVPIEDDLLIEARVRPSDIAFLRPGQDAMVKISAYDFSIYGGFPGTLEQISADTITGDKGESYYQITVRTKGSNLDKYREQMQIIPGMQATVDIKTGKKSILDFMLKPIIKTTDRALTER